MSRAAFDLGREREFVEMWNSDLTLDEIGEHFGVSPKTVSSRAKSRGLPSRLGSNRTVPLAGGRWVTIRGVQRWVSIPPHRTPRHAQ